MKWYFASRTRHQELLHAFAQLLEIQGETVVSEWLGIEKFTSYEDELERVQDFADTITKQVLDADIFVLISDAAGTDMFIELGIALGQHAQGKPFRIYIVGEHAKRSLMQLHPALIHIESLEELLEKENISINGEEVPSLK